MISRWFWAAMAGLAVAIALSVVASLPVSSIPWPDDADAVFVLVGVAPAVVGGLLAVRRPGNAVGKLLVLIGTAWLLGESARVYLWMSLHISLPGTEVAAWLMSWLFGPAWMLIPLLLVLFPSGRVTSPWLRWPIRFYVPFIVLIALSAMVVPLSLDVYAEYLAGFSNPLAIEALASLEEGPVGVVFESVSIASVLLLALAASVDLVLRWRRSAGVERLQIRAFALGTLTMILLFVLGAALAAAIPRSAENLTITVALSAPPLAVGVAVLRYRLYDIDRLVSRTLTYALVAGLLATVFASVAIGLPQLVGLTRGSPLLVAAATLAAAALFNPLRRRIQAWVDRRFNRARYDAQQEVEWFAQRLRTELELENAAHQVVDVVTKTMQPATASVWIKEQGP